MFAVLRLLQQTLPKPLLFGFYGAFGSFAGALILGEALWAWLAPPPPPPPKPPEPALRVVASDSVSVNQGDTNQFVIKIARDNIEGDVTVKCEGLGLGLSTKNAVIPAGATEAEMELTAIRDAVAGDHRIKVKAVCESVTGETELTVTVVKVDPPPPVEVDIVFVLDITSSMGFALKGIIQGIGDFAKELGSRELSVRLALLAFQDLSIREESQLLRFEDGQPFTANFESFRKQLRAVDLGGGGDEPESSLDGIAEAARLKFREGATKVLVLVTDASPRVPDRKMESIDDCLQVLKQTGISQLHLVVRPEHLQIYVPLQSASPGEFFDIVDAAGGSAGFAKILPSVSSAIAKITIQNRPAPPPSLGKPAPPPALPVIKGVQSSREYSADSKWQLVAAIAGWTSCFAIGISLILLAGQHFYLRQSVLPLSTAVRGMAIGCAAGLIGGSAGQVLYGLFPPAAFLDAGFRVLGWSILGATVAGGISMSIPNLRWDRALPGGAAGGFAGALGFLVATVVLPNNAAGDVGGRLLGATLLGFFIGLMVAWVEAASRSVWLELKYGAKEIRRVNLGLEPVSLGSNSRTCTIYVAGADPVSLRYRVEQSRVIKENVVTGQAEDVRDGNRQSLGSLEITVRTSSRATNPIPSTAPPPPAASPKRPVSAPAPNSSPSSQSGNASTSTTAKSPPLPPPAAPRLPARPTPAPPSANVPPQSTVNALPKEAPGSRGMKPPPPPPPLKPKPPGS